MSLAPTQNPRCLLQAPQAPERLRGSRLQSTIFAIFQVPAVPVRGDRSRQSQRRAGCRLRGRDLCLCCPHHKLLPTALKSSVAPCGPQGQATIPGWEEEAKGMQILSVPVTPPALCPGISMVQIMTATPSAEDKRSPDCNSCRSVRSAHS